MLKWLRRERLFIGATLLFFAFWYLALSGRLPSPPPNHSSPCDAAHKCQQDSPLADLGDWLFKDATSFFTCVLAFFTGALVWVSFKADKTARLVARSAIRQSVITRRQTKLIGLQADILAAQKDMQRQEFLITYRPRIRFRTVSFLPNAGESLFRAQFVNIGPTDARILHTNLRACVQLDGGDIVDIAEADFDEQFPLGLGNTRWIEVTVKEPGTPLERASRKITVIASVVYADGRDRILASSVARSNTPPSIRLNVSDGLEDMNWED
jgi:hypothetical protein